MQNPKSPNYITWENALYIAEKELYKAEKSGKELTVNEIKRYPEIIQTAFFSLLMEDLNNDN